MLRGSAGKNGATTVCAQLDRPIIDEQEGSLKSTRSARKRCGQDSIIKCDGARTHWAWLTTPNHFNGQLHVDNIHDAILIQVARRKGRRLILIGSYVRRIGPRNANYVDRWRSRSRPRRDRRTSGFWNKVKQSGCIPCTDGGKQRIGIDATRNGSYRRQSAASIIRFYGG